MSKRWGAVGLGAALAAFAQIASAVPITIAAAGPTTADIQDAVDDFRAALGDNNMNDPGPPTSRPSAPCGCSRRSGRT